MPRYKRIEGVKTGATAILHTYDGNQAKIELTLPISEAKRLMEFAVDRGGKLAVTINVSGEPISAEIIGGRIDSLDERGKRIGGTGVIGFEAISRE